MIVIYNQFRTKTTPSSPSKPNCTSRISQQPRCLPQFLHQQPTYPFIIFHLLSPSNQTPTQPTTPHSQLDPSLTQPISHLQQSSKNYTKHTYPLNQTQTQPNMQLNTIYHHPLQHPTTQLPSSSSLPHMHLQHGHPLKPNHLQT
eukprot:TRINITY_DN77791_c0_g1_i1.p1 TRINITY_DN77791_c0_g1~~TRINITY_DN77791_c0_g1_i1.p1  ORF type:complete len:163 (-),score=21.67 TRINITY_DN77791_c0_g1_i1:30-461(-)